MVLTVLSSLVNTTTLSCISKIIEEVKIVGKNEDKCSSCILYIVLFSIFFTVSIEIGVYLVYCKYMNNNKKIVSKYDYIYQGKNLLIIKWKKLNKQKLTIEPIIFTTT